MASDITVNGGYMYVYSGGTALNVDWTPCVGSVYMEDGAMVTFTDGIRGVYFGSDNTLISSAATMNGMVLDSGYSMYVMNGGTANNTSVTEYGDMFVYSGGVASDLTAPGFYNSEYGYYEGGFIYIDRGGTAKNANIGNGAYFYVSAGGTATGIKAAKGGRLDIEVTPETVFQGTYNNSALAVKNGLVSGVTIADDVRIDLYSGGSAAKITLAGGGRLYVEEGGRAKNITVGNDCKFKVYSGGSADGVTASKGARLSIKKGATVTNLNAAAGAKLDLFIAPGTFVQGKNAGSAFEVVDGYLSGFCMGKGDLEIYTGGVVDGLTMGKDCGALYMEGGKLTGRIKFSSDCYMYSMRGTLDFDVSRVSAGSPALVNGLAYCLASEWLAFAPEYTITVTDSQRSGKYILADGLDNFDGSLTVSTRRGQELGVLTVGGSFEYEDIYYALGLAGGDLTLTVANSRPGGDPDAVIPAGTPINGEIGFDGVYQAGFRMGLEHAGWYTVTGDFGRLNGSVSIVQGKKTVASGTVKNGVLTFNGGKDVLLDPANEYTIVVKNTDKGKSADEYSFTLKPTALFTKGDNSDDWTDVKTKGDASEFYGNVGTITATWAGDSDWVGYGDAVDYKAFTLDSAAKLSFSITATDATKFTICQLVEGKDTYTVKNIQATTLSKPKGEKAYSAVTKDQLLEAGTYYIKVESTNAAKGGNADYTVTLNDKSVFFTDGDDGYNDYLYAPKSKVLNPNKDSFVATAVEAGVSEVRLDKGVESGKWHNFAGYGDATDFAMITLDDAASLSFDVAATDAAKFTICQLVESKDKKGNPVYTVKTLQTTALAKAKNATEYTATTKNLLLQAGEYYVSVQSTNAAKGGAAYYNVTLNGDKSVFFTDGDDGYNDYLYDTKSKVLNPSKDSFVATAVEAGVTEVRLDKGVESGKWHNFAGYGDATDFATITLKDAASLSFDVAATDAAKFTICQLVESKDKKGNTVYTVKTLQTTALAKAKNATEYTATTKNLLLQAGEYYVSVQSTNAAKGGAAYYNVTLNNDKSVFFTDGDGGWNDYLYDTKTKTLNPFIDDFQSTAIDAETGGIVFDSAAPALDGWNNWVGYGDATDYAKITLDDAASLSFDVAATDAAKFTICQLVESKDKKGNTVYSVKTLQTTALAKAKNATEYTATTKNLLLQAGEYYVSVQSTNAAKGGNACYNVSVNQGRSDFFENLFIGYEADPQAEQKLNGTDVVLNWTASEADTKRKVTYYVSVDGGKETKVTKTTYTFKKLATGDHTFSVRAQDEYGNVSNVYERAFTVGDTTAPKVANLAVTVKEKSATVKFKGTDNIAVAGYYVTLDDAKQYIAAKDYNAAAGLRFNGLAYGEHVVTITAVDTSDNESTLLTKKFKVAVPKGAVALDTSSAISITDHAVYYSADPIDNYGSYDGTAGPGGSQLYKFTAESACCVEIRVQFGNSVRGNVTYYRDVDDGLAVKVGTAQIGPKKDNKLRAYFNAGETYYFSFSAEREDWNDWWFDFSMANNSNDTLETAMPISDYVYDSLYIGPGDPVDFYKFTIDEAGTYKYGACDTHGVRVTQTLYDVSGAELFTEVAPDDKKNRKSRYLAAGDYYLKIASDKATTYDIYQAQLA